MAQRRERKYAQRTMPSLHPDKLFTGPRHSAVADDKAGEMANASRRI